MQGIDRAPQDQNVDPGMAPRRERVARQPRSRAASAAPRLHPWQPPSFQFTDDPRGFPLDELDRIAPSNPVVIQAIYRQSYLNTAALKAMQIDAATPDPRATAIPARGRSRSTGDTRRGA